ncbi:hypothetical protein RISK_005363 [Rhodopirellula islandica]|uniref:Uncharacterized protein n=1 Tax=Rhodopirellula islandica TaxID=595434 RepID=A0A0J1B6D7_RHOIS|nr:hypothetical protein RISK_005363 [Rhodopirellula islandica]
MFNVVSSFLESDASRFVREVESIELQVERRTKLKRPRSSNPPRAFFASSFTTR